MAAAQNGQAQKAQPHAHGAVVVEPPYRLTPQPMAVAVFADTAKIVHLVRHGQGIHNVAAAASGVAAYKDQTLLDAPLNEVGQQQALALGKRIRDTKMQVDCVLVSPLTRTLQTATFMFQGHPTAVPFVAVELCREAFGAHPCDTRQPVSVVRKNFPHVDFSGVETDEDTWADPVRRETVREVSIRADKFLQVLRSRPERNIVVVSHGVFLETLLNRCHLYVNDEPMKMQRFENAEMRSIVIGGWT